MTRAIVQRIRLNAPPDALFDTYLDSKRHAAVTGRKVSITRKAGTRFQAFDGIIVGRTLLVVPKRLIVQAWRARHWKRKDLDSILILTFQKAPKGGQIDLMHVNVPRHDHAGVQKGWHLYYWKPWRAYLQRTRRRT